MTIQKHWAEKLADKIEERYTPPFIVSGGMTTSGPTHFGTVCEFLFPGTVQKILKNRGEKTTFYFIADLLDAFDSVPSSMKKYGDVLNGQLGKPLCNVIDPTAETKSFGDYFLNEATTIMKKMNLDVTIIRINEYYEQGKFDEYARLFMRREPELRKIIENTSGRELKKDWSVIMPICEKCGKIATTRVLNHNGEEYEYICDKDVKYVKGCGYQGKAKISDHKYKIVWRLHWPAWHKVFGTNLEGAGIDHHTKGGSYDTLKAVYKEIFNEEPPIAYHFGFILFNGGKYSKSKGTGMGITELSKYIPIQIIEYILLKPDLTENIDIVPTNDNLWKIYGEFERIGKISDETKNEEQLSALDRGIQKKVQAYRLCSESAKWKTSFSDVVLTYLIHQDWDKTSNLLKDLDSVNYLKGYVENWMKNDFVPDQYNFRYLGKKTDDSLVVEFLKDLDIELDATAIHVKVFEFSKSKNLIPKELFKRLYISLIGKEKGPRIGKLIFTLGVEKVKNDLL